MRKERKTRFLFRLAALVAVILVGGGGGGGAKTLLTKRTPKPGP
jgi:Flp pilus assembly CpaF family ATPase